MCEWANGGNLRQFWSNEPQLSWILVKETIHQLRGIADALKMMHGKNYRHGDIKPENIVRIKPAQQQPCSSNSYVGTLKICDMGLSKCHILATQYRYAATTT